MSENQIQTAAATASGLLPAAGAVRAGPSGFDLLDEIGRGGMGVVYRARDLSLDREVAVKLLQDKYPAGSVLAGRFLGEARVTSQLQHPGIPAVYQVGQLADGRPFLAMKLIKGQTLDQLLKADAPVDRLAVFAAVAQAVGYAHAHRVIHRDLKPANVMVGAFGEVQLMDWGLAKVLLPGRDPARPGGDPEATTAQTEIRTVGGSDDGFTQAGSVLGTPAYMSPEQAAGETDRVDTRSDVFGLGALLCVLLTGKSPFEGPDAEAVRRSAARGRTEAAFARLDGCRADPGVVALCKRCLALEPADRPADGAAVADAVAALRQAADERARQAELAAARAEVQAAEQAKRRRAVQRAAAVVAAVLLAGVVGTTLGLLRAEDRRREADTARQAADVASAEAQAKEAEASAVVKFFEDKVFVAARPKGREGGLGKDVTLRDAITASLPAVTRGFADQPLVEARLRLALGLTYWYLGDPKEAAVQYERARAIYTGQFGPEHREMLVTKTRLGLTYLDLGRPADARTLYEESLPILQRVSGPEHPDTLKNMSNLAMAYFKLGRYTDSLKLDEETLAARRRVSGPDHPDTLASMNNLALDYSALRRTADAARLLEETVALRKRVLGPDHPDTLASMNNLANRYHILRRFDDAGKMHAAVLAAKMRVLGPDHPDTLMSRGNLAETYSYLGRHADALKLWEETVAGFRRVSGPDHPYTLLGMPHLADAYAKLGRHVDALKVNEEALALSRAKRGPDHPDTLTSMQRVAESLVKLGRGAEAVPILDDCVRRAAGKGADRQLPSRALNIRLRYFAKTKDAAGCRQTAAMGEALNRTDAGSLYSAACWRAVAASVAAQAGQPAEAAADAQRAMAWMTKAVAAGYKDRAHMEKDADLDFLRARADFRELLAGLGPKQPAPPPAPAK